MSARTAGGDARVLDLDRDVAPVVQPRAVDLADRGGGDRLARRTRRTTSSSGSSSSDSITLRMSVKRTFGAASRSSPSLRWNSSRCSSGTSPTSRKLITCPSFIAAPFIVPSAATICSAASRWRRSSAACLPSSERAEVGRARAELARRLAGGEARHARRAGDARGRDAVLGHLGRRRRAPRSRRWAAPAVGVARVAVAWRRRSRSASGVALGGSASAVGVAVSVGASASRVGVAVGVGVALEPCRPPSSPSCACVADWSPNTASSDAGHDAGGDDERQQRR